MKTYTVQAGDTLGKIAAKTLGSASRYMEIAEANNMDNPNNIRVGQVLNIPGTEDDAPAEAPAPAPAVEATQAPSGGGELITQAQLEQIMPQAQPDRIQRYTPALNAELEKYQINTPLREAHFIAQIAHESGNFRWVVENLNYSAAALRSVFGKYFPDDATAEAYARQPEKIANRVYADRMGNGDEASGDGWKYKGRGLIQLTGKDNYTNFGKASGIDAVNNPDLLAEDANAAVSAAGWFWDMRKLNQYADADDILTITKRINGGTNGLEDRKEFLARAKAALGVS